MTSSDHDRFLKKGATVADVLVQIGHVWFLHLPNLAWDVNCPTGCGVGPYVTVRPETVIAFLTTTNSLLGDYTGKSLDEAVADGTRWFPVEITFGQQSMVAIMKESVFAEALATALDRNRKR